MAAHVGLDPAKDIRWAADPKLRPIDQFIEGKIDAVLGFPPQPQDLRARHIGPVPQSVFEGRGDFDPLGLPKVVFVETPALDWRERLALSVRFDRRGVAHLRWAFE